MVNAWIYERASPHGSMLASPRVCTHRIIDRRPPQLNGRVPDRALHLESALRRQRHFVHQIANVALNAHGRRRQREAVERGQVVAEGREEGPVREQADALGRVQHLVGFRDARRPDRRPGGGGDGPPRGR